MQILFFFLNMLFTRDVVINFFTQVVGGKVADFHSNS